jgi:hypothetical protein
MGGKFIVLAAGYDQAVKALALCPNDFGQAGVRGLDYY